MVEKYKGNSNPISQSDALRAKLIANSACSGDGVFSKEEIPMYLFVKIPNQEEADASFAVIGDDGTGGTKDKNNKEYAWNLRPRYDDLKRCGIETYYANSSHVESPIGDPSTDSNIGVPAAMNHTHPSGTNGSYMWQQPPSKTDISNASIVKQVWSMRARKLYVYNKTGVIATIPFIIYGK